MEPFYVHILGCGSALPTLKHNASAQIVELKGKAFLIDCGEGTQIALRRAKVHFQKISAVFISHLHGDHCFGLIGMISTFGMLGRTAPLHIYAPGELEPILQQQLDFFCQGLEYNVEFHAVDTTVAKVIYEDKGITITTLPLAHRMPCCGFLFAEKQGLRHIRRDMIDFYGISLAQINNIKAGQDAMSAEGELIPNDKITMPPSPVRSYAYCSDTRYIANLHKLVDGVTLLYHESTYSSEHADRARLYAHSTASEAAQVARDAHAGQLMLGHYSARYEQEEVLLNEAKTIFDNTILSHEGLIVSL